MDGNGENVDTKNRPMPDYIKDELRYLEDKLKNTKKEEIKGLQKGTDVKNGPIPDYVKDELRYLEDGLKSAKDIQKDIVLMSIQKDILPMSIQKDIVSTPVPMSIQKDEIFLEGQSKNAKKEKMVCIRKEIDIKNSMFATERIGTGIDIRTIRKIILILTIISAAFTIYSIF